MAYRKHSLTVIESSIVIFSKATLPVLHNNNTLKLLHSHIALYLLTILCFLRFKISAPDFMPISLNIFFVFVGIVLMLLFYISKTLSFVGGVYLIHNVLIEDSIIWSDFHLGSDDWELLQIGLVVFFLQVGRGKREQTNFPVGQLSLSNPNSSHKETDTDLQCSKRTIDMYNLVFLLRILQIVLLSMYVKASCSIT